MRLPRLVRSGTALCLLSLLGTLGNGLPSHSHADSKPSAEAGWHVLPADHHSHGTQIVEQDERAPAGPLHFAAASAARSAAVPVAATNRSMIPFARVVSAQAAASLRAADLLDRVRRARQSTTREATRLATVLGSGRRSGSQPWRG